MVAGTLGLMATNTQIRHQAETAAQHAAGVARKYKEGDLRILAIALSETAQALSDLAKRNRALETQLEQLKR